MNEENVNVPEVTEDVGAMDNDALKDAISKTAEKIRTQALLLGAQAICSTILQKVKEFENKPGKRTLNDHRRLVADIRKFCEIGLSRKINLDSTTSPIEKELPEEENEQPTAQNY